MASSKKIRFILKSWIYMTLIVIFSNIIFLGIIWTFQIRNYDEIRRGVVDSAKVENATVIAFIAYNIVISFIAYWLSIRKKISIDGNQ